MAKPKDTPIRWKRRTTKDLQDERKALTDAHDAYFGGGEIVIVPKSAIQKNQNPEKTVENQVRENLADFEDWDNVNSTHYSPRQWPGMNMGLAPKQKGSRKKNSNTIKI